MWVCRSCGETVDQSGEPRECPRCGETNWSWC